MNIKIQAVHFTPSEALSDRITRKLNKHFGHYPYIKDALVFLKVQENEPELKQIMEIRLRVPRAEFFAKTKDVNFYVALDENINKLRRQLEKYKQKVYANP
ncbi:MAG: ribosome-associated translation inhibitor RaiA [Bacteroidetes bacterium]|nr:MAG: ribosome-associated translation inhibitor RaiA [Bacteroidota bacterium]